MKISCLTTFLDGARRFEEGDVVTVADADGARFLAHGWATSIDGSVEVVDSANEVSLDVQNGAIGHRTVTGG